MKYRGFSLIELMITIAVLAILLTIGLPSFQSSLRSNRVATASNELMASLNLARTEALRNPNGAAICASADGESCSNDWNAGWIVWIDEDGDGTPEGDKDRVLRFVEGRDSLNVSSDDVVPANTIRFDNRGRSFQARELTIESEVCPDGAELVRILAVGLTGQVRAQKSECGHENDPA